MCQAIVVLLLIAVPVPTFRDKKTDLPQLKPGIYLIKWGSSPEQMGEILSKNMGWYKHHDTIYYFIWKYNPRTRVFVMWEASETWNGYQKMMHEETSKMSKYTFQFIPDEFKTAPNAPGINLSIVRPK